MYKYFNIFSVSQSPIYIRSRMTKIIVGIDWKYLILYKYEVILSCCSYLLKDGEQERRSQEDIIDFDLELYFVQY